MEKASFKAEVGRNQFLDIYVFPLSPVELYQLLEQRGRDWDWKSSRNPNVLSLYVSLKSCQVSYLEIHVLYLFHHTTAPSFPVAASILQYFIPWSHSLYTYSSPFYSRVSSITANPSRLSHKTQQSGRAEKKK